LPLFDLPAQHRRHSGDLDHRAVGRLHLVARRAGALRVLTELRALFLFGVRCPPGAVHHAQPQSLDITIATLDHPEQAAADRHIWTESRLPWLEVDPRLPEELQEHID